MRNTSIGQVALVIIGIIFAIVFAWGVTADYQIPALLLSLALPAIMVGTLAADYRPAFPLLVVFFLGMEYLSPSWGEGIITIPKLGFGILFVGFLITNRSSLNMPSRRIFIPILFWATYCVATLVWSIDIERSLTQLSTILLLLVCYWVVASYVQSLEDINRFWQAFVVYAVIDSLYAFYQFATGLGLQHDNIGYRAGGLGVNANESAYYIGIGFLIVFAMQIRPYTKTGLLSKSYNRIMILAILLGGLLSTASRGGIGATALGVLALLMRSSGLSKNKNSRSAALALIGIVVVLAFVIVPEMTMNFDARLVAVSNDELGGRVGIFEVIWSSFLREPWFGYGLNSSTVLTKLAMDRGYSTHNSFLTVLVDGGIAEGILYIVVISAVVATVLRIAKSKTDKFLTHGLIFQALFLLSFAFMFSVDVLVNKILWVTVALLEATNKLAFVSTAGHPTAELAKPSFRKSQLSIP